MSILCVLKVSIMKCYYLLEIIRYIAVFTKNMSKFIKIITMEAHLKSRHEIARNKSIKRTQ